MGEKLKPIVSENLALREENKGLHLRAIQLAQEVELAEKAAQQKVRGNARLIRSNEPD